MYTLSSFPHFFYIFYVFIKIINTSNHMVCISEYQSNVLWSKQSFNTIFSHFVPPEAEMQELK